MAKRRVQSDFSVLGIKPGSQDENIFDTISYLKDLEGMSNSNDLYGTSQIIPEEGDVILPDYSAGVEQGLPEEMPQGIELLAEIAGAESREDAIDSIAPTAPPEEKSIPKKVFPNMPEWMAKGVDYAEGKRPETTQEESQVDLRENLPEWLKGVVDYAEGRGIDRAEDLPQGESEASIPKKVFPNMPEWMAKGVDYAEGRSPEPGVTDGGMPEGIELLAEMAGAESREDAIDSIADTAPPGQMSALPFDKEGKLPDPLEFIRQRIKEEPELAQYLPEETIAKLAETESKPKPSGYTMPPAVEALPDSPTVDEVKSEDIPSEGLGAVPGAVEAAQSNEKIVKNIENLLGLKQGQIPDEVWETAKLMQDSLTKQEADTDYIIQQLKSRMESGQMSTLEKFALGLAIATPIIMGMVLGKEAFFSSLAGVGKGLSDSITQRNKMDMDILTKIGDVQTKRKEISEKRSKIKEDIIKNIENPAVKKLFNNYDVINITKGEDGQPNVTIGKDARIFGDKIGLTSGDESEALWYDTNLIRDDDDVKNFKTASKDGKVALGKMKDANKSIDDVIEIMGIIKEQHPSLYKAFAQGFQPIMYTDKNSLKKFLPGTSSSLTIDVVGEDGKVKTVQALPVLKQKITALQDVYNKEYLGGNRLTSNMLKHWEDVFPDASSVSSWLKSDYDTMYQRAKDFKNILNQRATENLVAEGFIRDPLEKVLPTSVGDQLNYHKYQEDVQDIEANPEKYRSKVK